MTKWGERKPAMECRCRACGWRGLTAGRLASMWFIRAYLALSVLALVAQALKLIDLPRVITPPVVVGILIALPLVPTVAGRFEICPSCRARSIETVPKRGVDAASGR